MIDALDTAISESGGDPSVIHERERSRTLEIMDREGVADHLLAHERAVIEQSHREAQASSHQLAQAVHHWPTDEEVTDARKYGFGYGTGAEPYVNAQTARVYGSDLGTIRREMRETQGEGEDSAGRTLATIKGLEPGTNLDLSKHPDIRASLKDVFAKTALAANRIPLATLGFDPARVVVDMAGKLHYGHDAVFGQYGPADADRDEELWERAGKELTAHERQKEFQWLSGDQSDGGDDSSPRQRRYERLQSTVPRKSPGDDQIYVAAAGERMSRATLLHETIHRGIELLRTGNTSPEVATALKTLGFATSNNDEERFVEHLIGRAGFRQPGSTQYGKTDELARFFGTPEKRDAMEVLERAAQDLHAKRRERGPRMVAPQQKGSDEYTKEELDQAWEEHLTVSGAEGAAIRKKLTQTIGTKGHPTEREVGLLFHTTLDIEEEDYSKAQYRAFDKKYGKGASVKVLDAFGPVVEKMRKGMEEREVKSPTQMKPEEADFTRRFNTPLEGSEEKNFKKWLNKTPAAPGDGDIKDHLFDYDLRGWWKAHPGEKFDPYAAPPEFDKPNHPTFSEQSVHHGAEGFAGGKWDRKGNLERFTPGEKNLYSTAWLQRHFDLVRPEAVLNDTRKSPPLEAHFIDQEQRHSLHLGSRRFPTEGDAATARMFDYGYGTSKEAYINRLAARVGPDNVKPDKNADLTDSAFEGTRPGRVFAGLTQNMDLTKPENAALREKLGPVFTQAAMAADRIPLAALGFDPSRLTVDADITREQMNRQGIAGQFKPQGRSGDMYAALSGRTPVTIVHESMHRGLAVLREQGGARVRAALRTLGIESYHHNEELAVTYLLARMTGDPEYGAESYSRDETFKLFRGEQGAAKRRALEVINDAAADLIAKRRERGPR